MTEVAASTTTVEVSPAVPAPAENGSAAVVTDQTAATAEAQNGATSVEKTNGNSNGAATNGSAKKASKKVKAEPEPPKDPKEDPAGWLKQQSKIAMQKANYYLLDWVQILTAEEEKRQPIGKNGHVTKSEFLNSLQDGTLLVNLANKLSPGAIETVHEGEDAKKPENQTANVEAFINFAKEKAGLGEDQVFSVADLREKGKAGYEAVFNTVFQIAVKSQEQFNQAAIDMERFVEDVKNAVAPSIVAQVMNYINNIKNTIFKRGRPSTAGKPELNGDKTENGEAPAQNGTSEVQEPATKVDVAPTTVSESQPAAATTN